MALTPLDRRTRFDVDLRPLSPDEFLTEVLPPLVAQNGTLVAEGMAALDAPALAVEVGDRSWTLIAEGGTLVAREGTAEGAVIVTLDEAAFSDWAQLQRSFNGMAVM